MSNKETTIPESQVSSWQAKYGKQNVGLITVGSSQGPMQVYVRRPDREIIFHYQGQPTIQAGNAVLIANCVLEEAARNRAEVDPNFYASLAEALAALVLRRINREPVVKPNGDATLTFTHPDLPGWKASVVAPDITAYTSFLDLYPRNQRKAIESLVLLCHLEIPQDDDQFFCIYRGLRSLFPKVEYDLGNF